ncbi:MAG: hypothetical protein EP297_03060 [Gammaproteobacteria bacterium]|nr:MAG: hypothetical protein EP297_03060 [Gammaproteobacteria bacterium]
MKSWQREIRDDFPTSLSLRTHRALSWLDRAEMEDEDNDARFIFLWISFNAAYANEIHDQLIFSEQEILRNFLKRLVDSDSEKLLYKILWDEFPKSVRMLIENKFVFKPFWDFQNGRIDEEPWKKKFAQSKKSAKAALGKMDTMKILVVVFERLYVLRNQLIHGGATWDSSVNRDQVRDGANIMARLVPTIIYLMMSHPDQVWGDPMYPVVD